MKTNLWGKIMNFFDFIFMIEVRKEIGNKWIRINRQNIFFFVASRINSFFINVALFSIFLIMSNISKKLFAAILKRMARGMKGWDNERLFASCD